MIGPDPRYACKEGGGFGRILAGHPAVKTGGPIMHKHHATELSFHSKQFWLARVFFIIYNMSDIEIFSKILIANCLLSVLNDLWRNCKYMLNLNGPRTKMVIRVACVESVSARVQPREQKLDWKRLLHRLSSVRLNRGMLNIFEQGNRLLIRAE